MSDDLHGNEKLDYKGNLATALINACNNAADAIDDHASSRSSWVTHAETDFKGYFSQLFAKNANTASGDGVELATALRNVAIATGDLKASADAENTRRAAARQWIKDHPKRHGLSAAFHGAVDEGKKALGMGDDDAKPKMDPAPKPTKELPVPPSRKRETPAKGHGGGGSTSSARPDHLRFFATRSAHLNHELRTTHLAKVRSALTDYVDHNNVADISDDDPQHGWGQLHAHGVIVGFKQWLDANDNDVAWAKTIAAAFAKAGGDHSLSTLSNASLGAALKAAHVSATRADLVIKMPWYKGTPLTNGFAVDPVNTTTGNFIEEETDLGFTGFSGLSLVRMYNSFTTEAGAFGPGWSSLAEAGLTVDAEQALFVLADGRGVVFPRNGNTWGRAQSDNLWLSEEGDGDYRVTDNAGRWWSLSSGGRLTAFGSGPGTTVTLSHDADGRLALISHERGRSISLTWDGSRVVAAETSDGRHATYTYDEAGYLVRAVTHSGTRAYDWIPPAEGDQSGVSLIGKVTDADGVVELLNTYDELRRARTQVTQHGRLVRFSYLPGNVTVVDDEDGTDSNTWISDAKGRLVGIIDSHDNRQSTAWDAWGNQVMFTQRDGATTVHEYDERGRRTRTVLPSNAEFQYEYDEQDRMTTVVSGDGAVTTLSYAGDERGPASVTDPAGGVTRFEWDGGLLRQVTDPTGVVVTLAYDEFGQHVATSDADGNTTTMSYDAAGRLLSLVSPLGNRTEYTYDVNGRPSSRIQPDGSTWTFEHTAAGRMSAIVDPLGARTATEYDDTGSATRVIDPLGRVLAHDYDPFGNIAGLTLPDGRRWEFTHDSLSRLVAATSPDGGTWTQGFDAVGTLTSVTDPTGAVATLSERRGQISATDGATTTRVDVDPLGRPLTSVTEEGSTVFAYDPCGRVVEIVDGEGGLTRIERDAAGRQVSVTSPEGKVHQYEYNHLGRLAVAIDPAGARTTFSYDGDGRLTTTTLPTGETALTQYDTCGRPVVVYRPGAGSWRYTYDLAGRIVETRDPVVGRRRFVYDAAGQLVEAINGNGGSTRYGFDPSGRMVTITDANGGVTTREFDPLDNCVAQTDPLGRTMRAGYDGAGRQLWQEGPDGHRVEWQYDAAGQLVSVHVDRALRTEIARDPRGRRTIVTDHLADGGTRSGELTWDRCGRMLSRTRDGRSLRWAYDADGRRTAMTDPDGTRTTYSYDAAGNPATIDHPLLGRAVFTRDAAGRLVEATAGDIIQSWSLRDGFVVSHDRTSPAGASHVEIERDEDGRITAMRDGDATTQFGYDEACQLVSAQTGEEITTWSYDGTGRLVAETTSGRTVEYVYDAASQLTSVSGAADPIRFAYDAAGRRISRTTGGTTTTYTWDPLGWLSSIDDGTTRHHLSVDSFGELVTIDDHEVFQDSATWGAPPIQVNATPVLAAGPLTGVGATWAPAGWRAARGTSARDPWASPAQLPVPGLEAGVTLGAAGGIVLGGLELLGARAYDPATRGFLSVDPLEPTAGVGWEGNPYSYAGNDPLHALDPLGLKPATDAQLDAYAKSISGWHQMVGGLKDMGKATLHGLDVAAHWVGQHWKGLLITGALLAGGVLASVFLPPPADAIVGGGLLNAGIEGVTEYATGNHELNWKHMVAAGVSGAVGGALGESSTIATKLGTKFAKPALTNAGRMLDNPITSSVISGAGSQVVNDDMTYVFDNAGHESVWKMTTGLAGTTTHSFYKGAISGLAPGAAEKFIPHDVLNGSNLSKMEKFGRNAAVGTGSNMVGSAMGDVMTGDPGSALKDSLQNGATNGLLGGSGSLNSHETGHEHAAVR